MSRSLILFLMFCVIGALSSSAALGQPTMVSFQGSLMKGPGESKLAYDGQAEFKLAILCGGQIVWNSDAGSAQNGDPTASTTVDVDFGVFGVMLGDPARGMPALTSGIMASCSTPLLRIWVDTGEGFELLPDAVIGSTTFSLHSETADGSASDFAVSGELLLSVQGVRFSDGSVQTTAGNSGVASLNALTGDVEIVEGANVTITPIGNALRIASTGTAADSDWTISGGDIYRTLGNVGIGTIPSAKLHVVGDVRLDGQTRVVGPFGDGQAGSALRAENTSAGGIALWAETASTDAAAVIVQEVGGTGDVLRGFRGGEGSPSFRVDNAGEVHTPGLIAATIEGPSGVTDFESQARVVGAFGNGQSGVALRAENSSTSGIALWAQTEGDDATAVFVQEASGTGDIIRGFSGGEGFPSFRIDNDSRVHANGGIISTDFVPDGALSTFEVRGGSVSGSQARMARMWRDNQQSPNEDILAVDISWSQPLVGASAQFIECALGAGGDVKFRVDDNGEVYADGTFHPGGADFAELMKVSTGHSSVEAGDVMVIDPSAHRAIVRSTKARSRLVAGVYSTNPGLVGSERDWDPVDASKADLEPATYKLADFRETYDEIPLAVVGIVPCKVSAENGPIQPGDLLVTSTTPGHAMRDDDPRAGTIVAKALGVLRTGTGTIDALVTLQ